MHIQKFRTLINLSIKIFFLFFIQVSPGYADNPCGVSCTQTIANNAIASALSQANAFTSNAINTLNNRIYETLIIYAETSANITAGGGTQWAFGDGDTGSIGIPLVDGWELYAVSFQARSVSANTDVTMIVRNVNDGSTIYQFTAPLLTTNGVYTAKLTSPITIPAGVTVGFATSSVSAGTVTGARVAVWLRRHPD